MDVFASFFTLLYSIIVRRNGVDKLLRSPSKKGWFDISSYYIVLVGNNVSPFSWKSIWKMNVPLRVAFFAWLVALGKILIMDDLRQ